MLDQSKYSSHSFRIGGSHSFRIGGSHSFRIGGSHSFRIGGSHSFRIGGSHSFRIGGSHNGSSPGNGGLGQDSGEVGLPRICQDLKESAGELLHNIDSINSENTAAQRMTA